MNLKDLVPEVSPDRNYWLVRTQGGDYYGEFLAGSFIAINWNEINDLESISDEKSTDDLIELIKKIYKDEKRPNHAVKQIRQFTNEMKKGDIVIIPGANSAYISYGQLLDDNIYFAKIDEDDIEEGVCPFVKRRKVAWLKTQSRDELDPYLYRLLYSHHTITNANDYAAIIDRTLNQFYIKDGKAHFILKVTEVNDVSAIEIANAINNSITIIDEFNKFSSMNLNKNNIDIKINVQCPGIMQFLGDINSILVIGMVTMLVVGGGFKFKKTKDTVEGQIKTDGFMSKLIEFLDHLHKNKMELLELKNKIAETTDNLKIEVPKSEQLLIKEDEEKACDTEEK